MKIAIDAMSGKNAPHCIIKALVPFAISNQDAHFLLYGDEPELNNIIAKIAPSAGAGKHPSNIQIIHTEQIVEDSEKPAEALRYKRKSSLSLAIKAVKTGGADAVISAGNTGALMAISKVMLRTLKGIDRPAIGTIMPNLGGSSVMLDLGANLYCTANNLFEFAVMGHVFAKIMLEKEQPSIGILNIGEEEEKGNETIKQATKLIKESILQENLYGYIEGDDIAKGLVDVVVTDGFSGNIALKTAEGTARMFKDFIEQALTSSLRAKLGGLLAKPALRALARKLDPSRYNGAMLLGLNGIVIKSHGSADEVGFQTALEVTKKLTAKNINNLITKELEITGYFSHSE